MRNILVQTSLRLLHLYEPCELPLLHPASFQRTKKGCFYYLEIGFTSLTEHPWKQPNILILIFFMLSGSIYMTNTIVLVSVAVSFLLTL